MANRDSHLELAQVQVTGAIVGVQIQEHTDHVMVEGCSFEGCEVGLYVGHTKGNLKLATNSIVNSTLSGVVFAEGFVGPTPWADWIYSNTITHSRQYGILVLGDVENSLAAEVVKKNFLSHNELGNFKNR